LFFFSSRRRHTRSYGDWSSDVCSSDLGRTRLCTLDPVTRRALASDFFGEWNVPTQAITMGLGTIFDARKVLLLALGEHKASIIREVAEGPVSPRVPASYLQEHADASVLIDVSAGSQLTSSQTPWAGGK